MRKYSKLIVVGSAIAALAAPSVAMADAPTAGVSPLKDGPQGTEWVNVPFGQGTVGVFSRAHIQNGQVISQMAQDGGRSANVQLILGH